MRSFLTPWQELVNSRASKAELDWHQRITCTIGGKHAANTDHPSSGFDPSRNKTWTSSGSLSFCWEHELCSSAHALPPFLSREENNYHGDGWRGSFLPVLPPPVNAMKVASRRLGMFPFPAFESASLSIMFTTSFSFLRNKRYNYCHMIRWHNWVIIIIKIIMD